MWKFLANTLIEGLQSKRALKCTLAKTGLSLQRVEQGLVLLVLKHKLPKACSFFTTHTQNIKLKPHPSINCDVNLCFSASIDQMPSITCTTYIEIPFDYSTSEYIQLQDYKA